jgi:sugar phosphate isomerase/epimerase
LEKIDIASRSGYSAIELWAEELTRFEKSGRSLPELRRILEDSGLSVASVITLSDWMQSHGFHKDAAFREVRRRLEQAAAVGAAHIVASPVPDSPHLDIPLAAARYRELLEEGQAFGVRPAMEFLGFQHNVFQLEQALAVVRQADHSQGCLVLDPFHLFRGGSGFGGIRDLSSDTIAVCHFNDAPASPPQFEQTDADRVFPGDGILPLESFLRDLDAIGYGGFLSLELFNPHYWTRNLEEVARTGREKTEALIRAASETGLDNSNTPS